MRRIRKAFTLIELLVVIAIIAILAAILVPAVNRALWSAMQVNGGNNLRQVALALNQYELERNGYPYNEGGRAATYTNWRQELFRSGLLGDVEADGAAQAEVLAYELMGSPVQRKLHPLSDSLATFSASKKLFPTAAGSARPRRTHSMNVSSPTRTMLVMDGTTKQAQGADNQNRPFFLASTGETETELPDYLFDDTAYFAMVDGHVENSEVDDIPLWSADKGSDGWHFWRGFE